MFLQKWKVLLRADGLDKLEEMTTQIRSWGELEDDFI
jgi:hypothetical protein